MKKKSESLHICILACVFWPIYPGQGGRQAYVLAETLARAGYSVSVVTTFPLDFDNKMSSKHRLIARENLNGVEIIRVPALLPTRSGIWRKLMFYLSFAFTSLLALPFIRKTNLVLGLDPAAPYLLLPSFLFSHILRAKYIVRVTDLWPDVFFDFEVAKSKFVRKIVSLLTITAYKKANHIMAFTPNIKPGIMKYGIPEEKISAIEIAVDTSVFRPISEARKESTVLGLPNLESKFVVLYSGAFALTYDFDAFLEAAKRLEGLSDVLFVLLGDGDAKVHILEKLDELKLKNVILLPPVTEGELVAKYINCSDVCVVPLKPEMVTSTITRPSKTFEFWACGKSVISCSEGELMTLMKESQAGIALKPGEPEALAKAIKFLYLNREVAEDMGGKGREFVVNRFSYDVLETNLKEMIGLLIH
ncbi:glycosyltransferase family 4 protein [candidate division WOR-3 bacterium]|nr:glycosyltransferase family 4 protein [candidate division WOR-3 bacterium]